MPGVYNRYSRNALPLHSVRVHSTLKGLALGTSMQLIYDNETNTAVDALFVMSMGDESVINSFEAHNPDCTISLSLLEKFEPDFLFDWDEDQPSALGRGGDFIVDQNQNSSYFTANIGSIPPYSKTGINLQIATQCDVTNENAVRFFLPNVCTPRYVPGGKRDWNPLNSDDGFGPNISVLARQTERNMLPYTFEFRLEVKAPCLLAGVTSPTHDIRVDAEFSENDARNCQITLATRHEFTRDMEVHIYLAQPFEAHVVIEPGDMSHEEYERFLIYRAEQRRSKAVLEGKKPLFGELRPKFHRELMHYPAVMISFTPDFDELCSHYGVSGPESFLSEYIFLVDRGQSMSGAPIANLRETLMLCLKSLPTTCLFNMVGYGSVIRALFENSRPYIDEYVNEACRNVKKIKPDLGGKDLFGALEWVFSNQTRNCVSRQIFVFCNSAVNNTHQVLELVRNNTQNNRVFSIGIGGKADSELIYGLASAGNGTACNILDEDRMQTKVLALLKKAMQPVISDLKVEWSLPDDTDVVQTPQEFHSCFQGDTITSFAFILHHGSGVESHSTGTIEEQVSFSPNLLKQFPTFESDRSMSIEDRSYMSTPAQASLNDDTDGYHSYRLGSSLAKPSSITLTNGSTTNGNSSFSYTYRLVSRFSGDSYEDEAKDDDSGYNEMRRPSTKTSSSGSARHCQTVESSRFDKHRLRRVLHEIALRRRILGEQSSSDLSRDTEDTFDRVEAWATTGYTSRFRRDTFSSRSTSNETSASMDEELATDFKHDRDGNNIILTVPYGEVPHVSIRGSFAGKPFVHHVPINLSPILDRKNKWSKDDVNGLCVHHLAAKSVIRDMERQAYKEMCNHPDLNKRKRYMRDYDIPKRWKKKIADVSRATNITSNYTQCSTLDSITKHALPKHVYILAPPSRLVRELSRRSQKQRHSGWHSADNQLGKSISINEDNELSEIDKMHSAEILYNRRSLTFRLSTPMAELAVLEDKNLCKSISTRQSKNLSILAKINEYLWPKAPRSALVHSNSFSPEGTSLLLLVNDQHPEGFWNLDENFADALDVNLDELINASPIVALPIPQTCSCAKDITIMVEDFTESPPEVRRKMRHRQRSNLVRQGNVGGDPVYALEDIFSYSESESVVEDEKQTCVQPPANASSRVVTRRQSLHTGWLSVLEEHQPARRSVSLDDKRQRYALAQRSFSTDMRTSHSCQVYHNDQTSPQSMIAEEIPPSHLSIPSEYPVTGTIPSSKFTQNIASQVGIPRQERTSSVQVNLSSVSEQLEEDEVKINQNLLNVGIPRAKKSLRGDRRKAIDYEDEVKQEEEVGGLCASMQPSSLSLSVPDMNGNHRRGSYDEQAFRERQKILNRDYLKLTDPDYYKRTGSVDEGAAFNRGNEPPDVVSHPTDQQIIHSHVSRRYRSAPRGSRSALRQRCIKKAVPRTASGRRMSYHTVSKCSSEDVFVDQQLGEDYFSNRRKPENRENRIWATALALVYLEKRCGMFFGEWELMAGKAQKWMREQKMPRGFDIDSVKASARQVLHILRS